MSPDGSQASTKAKPGNAPSGAMSLERKLELLEPRFTSPSAPTNNVGVEASLGLGQSPSASRHSFSFEPPSGSRSSIYSSGASNASNLPSTSIRSKRKSSKLNTSLHAVSMAAEKQMRKVQASPTFILQQDQERSMSALASPPMSNASGSNSTLITSHVNSSSQPQVVAESPPTVTSPAGQDATKETSKAARSVLGSTTDKRKSIPVKKPPTVLDLQQQAANASAKQATPSRKRSRLQFASEHTPPKAHSSLDAHGSNSRDRSNPARTKANKQAPPRNNTLIRDFFSTAVKKGKTEDNRKRPAVDSSKTATVQSQTSMPDSASKELDRIRSKCQELEQLCKDKDAQLKAVSNNQTILHTSLRSALSQKENELEELKQAREQKSALALGVIEKLIRSENAREVNELRHKLASDGARLGRIVYTRAGMRAVESWEEGNASKELQKRRAELKSKRTALEARREEARKASEELKDKENDTAGMLGVLEAEESVRLHLDSIQQKEAELADEEEALMLEKADHIRSLKLLASEDASRFRSRPKLHGRYILLALLGKGGFSEVWRAFDLTELREVAVKIHQLDPRWNDAKKDNYIRHVSREYEIHRDVRHARIVSLYDVFEIDNNSFATVLECCKGTDLDTLLKARKRLPERDARAILIQILSGMQYLSHPSGSRQGIIHYDLKPGNILFDELGDAKITDFGLSKIVDADPAESMELTSQGAGTYWYLPPECFVTHQSVRISNKVDVWSIGVIYYQMLYGKRPFGDGQSQDKVLTDNTMLNAREVRFPELSDVSKGAKEFIQSCLTYDQAFRPSVGQLCENPYILKKQL